MNLRGQAAMEFLMTYGWAILAAVIVIGVLASFGVFSPSKYVPNQCILTAPLGCNAGVADTTGVEIEVRNGAGEGIVITNVVVSGCADDSIEYLDNQATPASGTIDASIATPTTYTMPDQALVVFTLVCTQPTGKFQGDLTVTYTKTGSSLELTSSGSIVDAV